MVDTFACSFTASELNARSGISLVIERLREMKVPDDRVGDVQIALAEAINNVVEHAYAGTTAGDVRIRCNLHSDRLWVRICDAGTPYPEGQLPEGKPADISGPIDELPEGGFGWLLIRALTSDIQYQYADGNNELSLCFEMPEAR